MYDAADSNYRNFYGEKERRRVSKPYLYMQSLIVEFGIIQSPALDSAMYSALTGGCGTDSHLLTHAHHPTPYPRDLHSIRVR